MLKKRIIFTLLYDSGYFVLSRNFRLQRVGDLDWLQKNYNFSHIAFFIDELIVLDVTRGTRDVELFSETLKKLAAGCFVPIAAGGGIRDVEQARRLLNSGADKIVINTPLFENVELVEELKKVFGQQCIVGSVDMKLKSEDSYQIMTDMGAKPIDKKPIEIFERLNEQLVGELYLNSIDRDGTGQGYDLSLLDELPTDFSVPVILAGGVGNGAHFSVGFEEPRVDAVATAHLFNFIGDGLQRARESMIQGGAQLAVWPHLSDIELNLNGGKLSA